MDNSFVERVDEWFDSTGHPDTQHHLPGGPWYMMALAFTYVVGVVWIGPKWMKNRDPFDLKLLIRVYNLINIVLNSIWFCGALVYTRCLVDCWNCRPAIYPFSYFVYFGLGYMYLKVFDLLDTVFFVLRKKNRQVCNTLYLN